MDAPQNLNENTNHSKADSTELDLNDMLPSSSKRQRNESEARRTQSKTKSSSRSRNSSARGHLSAERASSSSQMDYEEPDECATETHQFEEDGDLIQMEINDGGAAAAEFGSEPETANDEATESESELSDQETAEGSDTPEDQEHNLTSVTRSPVTSTSGARNHLDQDLLAVEIQHRESLKSKLENMNSTLEVMKDFFLSGSFGENGNRKKNQGGGDRARGKSIAADSNSETTILP